MRNSSSLTEEEAKALENGEKVSIEQTFNSAEPEGDGIKKSSPACISFAVKLFLIPSPSGSAEQYDKKGTAQEVKYG